jgi:hypothetical protein
MDRHDLLESTDRVLDQKLVVVRSEWHVWRTATVALDDLSDVHWAHPPGAPRPLIHAYVYCTAILSGVLTHDCRATPAPHRLKVCVLRTCNWRTVFENLVRQADARQLMLAARSTSSTAIASH